MAKPAYQMAREPRMQPPSVCKGYVPRRIARLSSRTKMTVCHNCGSLPHDCPPEPVMVSIPYEALMTLIETSACVGDKARTRYNAAKGAVLEAMANKPNSAGVADG
jgi:hypothetical protein